MIPDTIISIIRNESMGLQPPYGKIFIRKVKHMKDNYPNTVCLDCLEEAIEDTLIYDNRVCKWGECYSCYIDTCEVCGENKECTEARDAGYPSFDYALARIRARKIKKITKK